MVGPPSATLETGTRPAAAIDPRIRARRIEVRRADGRRKLQRLVDVGLLAAVAAAFVGALWTPLLDVDAVRVVGAHHTGADVVEATTGVGRGDRLVTVDVGDVGRRVAALPWVGEVAVRRSVDGSVTVRVTERTPVATVPHGAGAVLVDPDGRVLGPAVGPPTLPLLVGAGTVPPPGEFLAPEAADALVLADRLAALVPGVVARLSIDLTATLAQGGEVRFGDATQLATKLRSLQTVLDQVDLRCLARIDLRLPGSPVLTREERCS